MKTLWKKFNVVGKVLDLYCPQKRDKIGKPFGFVRFPEDHNTSSILEDLNNIWIDSYKLRVFIPKFERRNLQKASSQNHKPFEVGRNERVMGKSFVEASTGIRKEIEPLASNEDNTLFFHTWVDEREWLKDCLVGMLKTGFSWSAYKEELQEECGNRWVL